MMWWSGVSSGWGNRVRVLFLTAHLVIVALLFLGGKSMSYADENRNEDYHLIDAILSAAKHGELRDIDFIEKAFSTKFMIKRDDLFIRRIDAEPAILWFILSPSTPLFPGSVFTYKINTEAHSIIRGPYDYIDIESILITYANYSLCVTPDLIRHRLDSKESNILPGSKYPETATYSFKLKEATLYETSFLISEPDHATGCSQRLLIEQIKKVPTGNSSK